MQLFAQDKGEPVSSDQAIKGKDYTCFECKGVLRVKEGLYRRRHFFHMARSPLCRHSQKSLVHLAVQRRILEILSEENLFLEHPFPQINRIADVFWEAKKIIFEVQCSYISLKEVKERMADYASLGCRVIWILHSARFNRKTLSAAEHFLRPSHAYFTSIDENGKGIIYDQYEIFSLGRRIMRGSALVIDLKKPLKMQKKSTVKGADFELSAKLKHFFRFIYSLILKWASN